VCSEGHCRVGQLIFTSRSECRDLQHAITDSIVRAAEAVGKYIPNYRLRAEPHYEPARDIINGISRVLIWNGMARLTVFLETRSCGDQSAESSGHHAVLTDAAARVGEVMAKKCDSMSAAANAATADAETH
jgi:acetaldehyde dehydrogenase (acetylating)